MRILRIPIVLAVIALGVSGVEISAAATPSHARGPAVSYVAVRSTAPVPIVVPPTPIAAVSSTTVPAPGPTVSLAHQAASVTSTAPAPVTHTPSSVTTTPILPSPSPASDPAVSVAGAPSCTVSYPDPHTAGQTDTYAGECYIAYQIVAKYGGGPVTVDPAQPTTTDQATVDSTVTGTR